MFEGVFGLNIKHMDTNKKSEIEKERGTVRKALHKNVSMSFRKRRGYQKHSISSKRSEFYALILTTNKCPVDKGRSFVHFSRKKIADKTDYRKKSLLLHWCIMYQDQLAALEQDYCVLDTHNLFVCSTLEDEILVLGGRPELLVQLGGQCKKFGLELEPDRDLASYSGGEQAIICALLLLALLPRQPVRILFVHLLETLSDTNRKLLIHTFHSTLPEAELFCFTLLGPRLV